MRAISPIVALLVMLIFVVVVRALPPRNQANVAQADVTQGFACPTGGTYQDIPDLNLTLQTSGGPVMLTSILNFRANPTAGIDFFPVIDGVASNAGRLQRFIGEFSGQVDVLPLSRVYAMPAGVHTFGVRVACQSQILVDRGWLTAYELPAPTR
jgi:flagellin-like protein